MEIDGHLVYHTHFLQPWLKTNGLSWLITKKCAVIIPAVDNSHLWCNVYLLAYDGGSAPVDAPATEGAAQQTFSPPAYDVATKLPTYAEAEKSKAAEAGFTVPEDPVCPDRAAREQRRSRGFFSWVCITSSCTRTQVPAYSGHSLPAAYK